MTTGQLIDIIRSLPRETEVALLLPDSGGLPNYESQTEVRCVQVDYTGEGEVEQVSIVFT